MQTFKQIQYQIGERGELRGHQLLFMRITENLGELVALENGSGVGAVVGDTALRLCEYCCLANVAFPTRVVQTRSGMYDAMNGLVIWLGRLCGAHRLYQSKEVFEKAQAEALRGFVWHLELYAKDFAKTNLLMELNQRWNEIEARLMKKDQ